MAYPTPRSVNADLREGMSDGKYKKVVNDRGGYVEPTTHNARVDLHDLYYGIHEEPSKVMPDNRTCTTPQYVPTPPARPYC